MSAYDGGEGVMDTMKNVKLWSAAGGLVFAGLLVLLILVLWNLGSCLVGGNDTTATATAEPFAAQAAAVQMDQAYFGNRNPAQIANEYPPNWNMKENYKSDWTEQYNNKVNRGEAGLLPKDNEYSYAQRNISRDFSDPAVTAAFAQRCKLSPNANANVKDVLNQQARATYNNDADKVEKYADRHLKSALHGGSAGATNVN